MAGFTGVINMAVVEAAVQEDFEDVAEAIADTTVERYRFKEHRNRRTVVVVSDADGVSVVNTSPFGAIDEWGSERAVPSAAMRSAAAEHGDFTPAAKS